MWYGIVPKHVFGAAGNGTYDKWNEDPLMWDGECIGTGPYKVIDFKADDYILFERFDDYWGAGDSYWGLPEAKYVCFQLYENTGQFWMAFEKGKMEGSAAFSVPFEKKDDYETNHPDEITVEVVDDLSIYWLAFNLNEEQGYAPLSQLPLRQAIAAAIDKEHIVAMVYGGHGEATNSFVYLESPNHKDDLPNNTYDLTKAAKILTDAGYTKDDDGWWCTPAAE